MSLSAGIRRRNLRKFDVIDGECECLRRGAVKFAGVIKRLEDRLIRIESIARHAIAAKPRDLEETWFRVEQIAQDRVNDSEGS